MFNDPGEFIKYLQGLIDRHESDLSIILNSLGIQADPTPERLIAAYEKYPVRFTQLLSEMEPSEDFMGFSFSDLTTKGSDGETGFQKLFAAGTAIVGAVNQAQNASSGKSSASSPVFTPAPPPPVQDDGSGTKLLVIGGIVIVVLVVVFIVIKSIKK